MYGVVIANTPGEDLPVAEMTTITYELGDATGTAPDADSIVKGTSYTIVAPHTSYKDGSSFSHWTDVSGTEYNAGQEITADADLTLTPVYEANTELGEPGGEMTVPLAISEGAPKISWQKSAGNKYVWQVPSTVEGKTIDIIIDVDTTNGKLDTPGSNGWGQCNTGTEFTIPTYGKTVTATFVSMSDGDKCEINGVEVTGREKTHTVEGSPELTEFKIVNTGLSWVKSIKLKYE